MTGATLRKLRAWYAMDSAVRLAKRLGCHASTLYRSEKRERVTPYVLACIDTTPTARAFVTGIETREIK